MSRSIAELASCAPRHLREYTDPNGPYAFGTYDVQGDPDRLEALDCLAPALLGVNVSGGSVIEMHRQGTSGAVLLGAMRQVLADPQCATTDFVGAALGGRALGLVADAIRTSKDVHGVKAVTVTKILHRKRPNLVPIIDRFVYGFYTGQVLPGSPYDTSVRRFWADLQPELRANTDWLTELASSFTTPDGRPLGLLRAADIVVWHHFYTGCDAGEDSAH
jgi:uncharacterized protein DUF6308